MKLTDTSTLHQYQLKNRLVMPPMVSFFMPWGYYIPLSTARMDWDPETRIVRYYTAPYPVWLLGVTMALCVLFAVMTWNALKRKEV